jgi:maleylacetoacetate isomerase
LEKVLQETAGKYSVGDTITAADLFLAPQCANALRKGFDLEKLFPTVAAVNKNLTITESYKRSAPESQIDYDPKVH